MYFGNKEKYVKDGRVEDVLSLLQVLALDSASHRSEGGLKTELSSDPSSAESWLKMAKEHPEFFRVAEGKGHSISLVARHVSKESGEKRLPLTAEQTQALLNTAIELHDRQIRRSQRWTVLIPIWVAVISGVFILTKTFIAG